MLLMGAGSHAGQPVRTDTMIIASYSPPERSLTFLSIPGNLWVTVPGFGQARVSEAYGDGGPRLALLTVESVTHIPIPYYALVDSGSFKQLVDALGGVSVRVAGRARLLDGAGALQYAVPSRDPQGSPDLMQRQLRLLLQLKRQAAQPQIFFQIPAIVGALGGSVSTNVPYDQIPGLAHMVMGVPAGRTHLAMLDTANATVTGYSADGENVLLPDPQHIRSLVRGVFPDPQVSRDAAVDVLNGSGLLGAAATTAAWLRQADVRVASVASADSFNYPHTYVLVRRGASDAATHLSQTIAALMQAPLIRPSTWTSRRPVVVILGRDFQDPSQQ